MNETNYAQIIVSRIISIIIYIIFIINFIMSGIKMFFNDKSNLGRILLVVFVITMISMLLIKKIKNLIFVIKEIKEKKKFNFHIRNIGQIFMGLSFITLISGLLFKFLKTDTNGIIIYTFLIGMVIGIVLITIDKILVVLKIPNTVLEIDKSDE